MTEKRRKAIIRRRIFVATLAVMLAVVIALIAVVVRGSMNIAPKDSSAQSSNKPSSSDNQTDTSKPDAQSKPSVDDKDQYVAPSGPEYVTYGDVKLDAAFSRLLLVNAENPLPEEYDTNVRDYLVEIDAQYRNNDWVRDIHKEVYPYITAMVAAAHADGVDLRVWSPFRTYAMQRDLFNAQVEREGGDEAEAATAVARPGTSEHNTGLCADFNRVNDDFEYTPMFEWMQENAEDYGFILRYPKDKQDITGVIYESWHWRFVGINAAKEMNKLGLTLEEYVEYKNLEPTVDMYSDDK